MQDVPAADLEAIAARAIAAATTDDNESSSPAIFVLRHFLATGRDDLRGPLGLALAHALVAAAAETSVAGRASWLMLFVEASAIADDERITDAVRALAAALSGAWPSADGLSDSMASVDACLHASAVVDAAQVVPAAIDELERVIATAYRPGEGLIDPATRRHADGAGHVRAASALLTAFEHTGRLPYSMLAEELLQTTRRAWSGGDFATRCETARVLCRLAALHATAEYRAAAVIAADADYRGDAMRLLQADAAQLDRASTAEAALYGITLREFMSLA